MRSGRLVVPPLNEKLIMVSDFIYQVKCVQVCVNSHLRVYFYLYVANETKMYLLILVLLQYFLGYRNAFLEAFLVQKNFLIMPTLFWPSKVKFSYVYIELRSFSRREKKMHLNMTHCCVPLKYMVLNYFSKKLVVKGTLKKSVHYILRK